MYLGTDKMSHSFIFRPGPYQQWGSALQGPWTLQVNKDPTSNRKRHKNPRSQILPSGFKLGFL